MPNSVHITAVLLVIQQIYNSRIKLIKYAKYEISSASLDCNGPCGL